MDLFSVLEELSGGKHVVPVMEFGDEEEWIYHFYSGNNERTDRVLPPEQFADYLDKEKPCLGICYGEGAFCYLVKAEAVPELPQEHKYLLVSNEDDFIIEVGGKCQVITFDGDPIKGFDEITLKALHLEG